MDSRQELVAEKARSLIGCGYVYGATGWICTRSRLDQQARQYPLYAAMIYLHGPKWLGKPCYDCAQLTRTAAKAAGAVLPSGSNSQWNAEGVWSERGVIGTMPDEPGLFVFTMKSGRMTHTAVTLGGGETADARGHAYGVVRREIGSASYTHWARLILDGQTGIGNESSALPTLRKGAEGAYVTQLQRTLLDKGYDLGRYGVDGKFGSVTRSAVRQFQRDHALAVDGIVGPKTWGMLQTVMG